MATSPARLAANRRNALKSTGPKTLEGKAASRLNAFRHGMAGEGILLAPGEDSKRIDDRARALARELGAVGEYGSLLAHRAALLSIRMERAASREMAVVASNVAAARDRFDEDRLDEVDGWIRGLDDPTTLRSALESLETVPEGLDHLVFVWSKLRDEIRSDDPSAKQQAALWLDLKDEQSRALNSRVDAEVERLRINAQTTMIRVEQEIDDRRDEAGIVASFDPSPEAALAHRYEAAAERAMYRAIRGIAEIRRARQVDLSTVLPSPQPAPTPPESVESPPPAPAPLGSFRAGSLEASIGQARAMIELLEPPTLPVEPRKKRPDLRKIRKNRR